MFRRYCFRVSANASLGVLNVEITTNLRLILARVLKKGLYLKNVCLIPLCAKFSNESFENVNMLVNVASSITISDHSKSSATCCFESIRNEKKVNFTII